jgi:hypothetical protein
VLLACALAKSDDRGLFSPKSVVQPLIGILDRDVSIANFPVLWRKRPKKSDGRRHTLAA